MHRRKILGFAFGLFCLLEWSGPQQAAPASPAPARLTLAPAGPFHVSGNQIVDSKGRAFLIRGTQLAPFELESVARDNRAGLDYGAHSATTLSAIRLRFNLNAVRIPVDVRDAAKPGYFAALSIVVRRANQMDMLAILVARGGGSFPSRDTTEFWSRCAAYFKDYPNVMFDAIADPAPPQGLDAHSAEGWALWRAGMENLIHTIRAASGAQPVIVEAWNDGRMFEDAEPAISDANVIYEASPHYSNTHTDAERDAHFGFLAREAPVIANGLDPEIGDARECAALPSDPTAASAVIEDTLNYFNARRISWTVSSFEPGKLVREFSLHDATSLEAGWTCGKVDPLPAGMGRIIQAHMRGSIERELFVVSGAGGIDIARGAFALAYGPVMAERDTPALGVQAPMKLGGISIQVTDSAGVTRPAGIFWASEGWGQTNFVIPDQSALGPARMTIVRDDGSRTTTNISIADTAPGFVTGHSCRGPAMGSAIETFPDGHTATSQISSCKNGFDCRTIAVPVAAGATTRVRIVSSGFRHAASAAAIELRIAGVRVPVVSYGPSDYPGQDQVTVEISPRLYGIGETDLICHLNGRISNATRIRIGAAARTS